MCELETVSFKVDQYCLSAVPLRLVTVILFPSIFSIIKRICTTKRLMGINYIQDGFLTLHSHIAMKTYLFRDYIRDVPTQSVHGFQLLFKSKSGIIYYL